MSEPMESASSLGLSVDDVLSGILDQIADMKRDMAGATLAEYPKREALRSNAEMLQKRLGVSHVQINSFVDTCQITLVNEPPRQGLDFSILAEESLCMLVVGKDRPFALDDLRTPFMSSHRGLADQTWRSWASVPIHINGCPAGSVCALEADRVRHWTLDDQHQLEQTARTITVLVEGWASGP